MEHQNLPAVITDGGPPAEAEVAAGPAPIGAEQLLKFTGILREYKAGKARTEARILASENWWKLRNTAEEDRDRGVEGVGRQFRSVSGWLHNVITSKHADAAEAYPEPNILPREAGDRGEADMLSGIIPCILEQNAFEDVWSDIQWQKLKTGTGAYKVVWDAGKLHGLGDVAVEQVNLLDVFWEPGVKDIQKSRYFFHTELYDEEVLTEMYPALEGKIRGQGFVATKFLYDDHVKTENKHTVIEVYYHRYVGGRKVLHYCKYVGDQVLFATENDPRMAERGLYDHGMFPYVFDTLFPIEGSPCGYGFVDLCRNPQTEIDLLKSSFVKNAMVGGQPRHFVKKNAGINEDELLDLEKPLVHVDGDLSELFIRTIDHVPLDGAYLSVLEQSIQELRETSGNTETSTGSTSSGVTAASAIAALQEASGKGSRDSTRGSYRAFAEVVELVIELIRQFYELPRQFRILGQYGAERYVTYTNAGVKAQHQGTDFGQDMGYRLPVFDIKVSAQKKNVYTKVSQNELALEFFQRGFFNPQSVDQTLMCLGMMDFDGRDELMQKVKRMGTMYQKLMQYMQISLAFAQRYDPQSAEAIAQDILAVSGGATGGGAPASLGSLQVGMAASDHITGIGREEHGVVRNARARASEASQPEGGRVMGGGGRS